MSKRLASGKWIYVIGSVATIAVTAGLLLGAPGLAPRGNGFSASKLHSLQTSRNAHVTQERMLQPLGFEPNEGQADSRIKYLARGNGYKLSLTSSEAIFTLHKRGGDSDVRRMVMDRRLGPSAVKRMLKQRSRQKSKELVAAVHMQMIGAHASRMTAERLQTGKVNYFIGNDPSKWHAGVPLYGCVRYKDLYPGIDLVFHGASKQTEFDYIVNPGANAGSIVLGFQSADSITTNAEGDLILATAAGPLEIHRPIAYQEQNGLRQQVAARFALNAKSQVSFAMGPYDHSRQLVIDPTVTYSTYFGGDFSDYGLSIALDGSGNAFVAGATDSDSIPGDNNGTNNESYDVFVTEISSTGTLVFTTLFGGSGDDFPGGIAVDSQGLYVSGTTDSPDFPATVGQTTFEGGASNGNNDAFATKLTLSGTFSWGTYIAGSDSDSGLGLAVDSGHNLYVVGETFSPDLGGMVGGVNPLPGGSAVNLGLGTGADDGYIVKLTSDGTSYLLVSYLGGSNGDLATGVALDGAGNIYVSGETISTDLPVTSGAVQTQCGTDGTCNTSGGNSFDDAFVFGIQANLAAYKYVTYYGGSNVDDAFGIATDANGDVFITGTTNSSDFPTVGTPFQSSLNGAQNAFVVELNPAGSSASYGTYLGGDGSDFGLGITLDPAANIYVTGQTSSSGSFPLLNPTQATFGGSTDAFVTVLNTSQNVALFSTYLGGSGDEDQVGGAIALDSSENIYVTGDTTSGNGSTSAFPTKAALDGTYGGGTCLNSIDSNVPCPDAFVTAYGPATAPDFTITAPSATTPSTVAPGTSATVAITLTELNGYSSPVNLTCSVTGTGTPLPACGSFSPVSPITPTSGGAATTLTITTTGAQASLVRPSKFFYAMWMPIAGLSLLGMGFSSPRTPRKKLLAFLMVGMVMAGLFLMPACGGGSNNNGGGGGGGGCSGCTPAGSYTVTITGAGTDASTTTHSTSVTLAVN